MEPFAIHNSDADLLDLKNRLAYTRWTDDFANEDWRYGANASEIRELVE
jgi:hypothetical protein